jgi:hypothetical protein
MTEIPRHLLPQIPTKELPDFRIYLRAKNVQTTQMPKSVGALKPIQKSVNQDKIDNLISKPYTIHAEPIITTSDGYIVDGHHRWVAADQLEHENIECIVCSCPLKQFLKLAHDFPTSYVKSVHELTTYGRYTNTTSNSRGFQMIKLSRILVEAMEKLPREKTDKLYQALHLDQTKVTPEEFHMGMNVELEHVDVTQGDIKKTALLVLAHLKEVSDYYSKLQKYVEPNNPAPKSASTPMSGDGTPNDQAPATMY